MLLGPDVLVVVLLLENLKFLGVHVLLTEHVYSRLILIVILSRLFDSLVLEPKVVEVDDGSLLRLLSLVVVQNVVLHLFGRKLEEHLNCQHLVLTQKSQELERDVFQSVLQLQFILSVDSSSCFGGDIDALHQAIVAFVGLEEVIDDAHRLKLVKDPRLLGLEDDPLEERVDGPYQLWLLFEVNRGIVQDSEVLIQHIVVDQPGHLRDKVEASLNVLVLLKLNLVHVYVL